MHRSARARGVLSASAIERLRAPAREKPALAEKVKVTNAELKAEAGARVRVAKSDDTRQMVFGWAMVAVRKDGRYNVDYHGHWTEPEDVEEAAYDFVLNAANGPVSGEQHDEDYNADGYLIESVAFTAEKLQAMGIDPGAVDLGHWVGLYIPDREAYERVRDGEKSMLSIDGWALESPAEPPGEFVLAGAAA